MLQNTPLINHVVGDEEYSSHVIESSMEIFIIRKRNVDGNVSIICLHPNPLDNGSPDNS